MTANQADFKKVTENIIEPMKRHWGAEFDAETVADYVDDLCHFSTDTLKAAMQKIRAEQKRKPTIAHIAEACKHIKPISAHPSKSVNDPSMPWVQKQQAIQDLVDAYLQQFRNISTIYSESQREGWDLDLMRYVSGIAMIQASMINKASHYGWSSIDIFGAGAEMKPEAVKVFFSEQRRQADTGSIDVSIPTGRINDWRAAREWINQQVKKKPVAYAEEAAVVTASIVNQMKDAAVSVIDKIPDDLPDMPEFAPVDLLEDMQ